MSAVLLFLASVSVTVALSTWRKKEMIQRQYISRLNKLLSFKGPLIKEHRRLEQIFQLRKSFFQKIFTLSGITKECKTIHVAGTKGKGSTVEFIASAICASNFNVGVFTSPHLHSARERIKLNGKLISQADFIELADEAIALAENNQWTLFFDLFLTLSLLYFGKKKPDFLVMECGIGGRYDSTNFLRSPSACVITSISMDHCAILGDTIEEIAWQKAGIIKPFSHVFTPDTQKESVLDVFQKQCDEMNATLHRIPVEKSITEIIGNRLNYEVQIENACLARAVLEHVDIPFKGLENFFWPCRMELFDFKNFEIILDGAHNGDSVELFLNGLKAKYIGSKILVLFGAGMEKSVHEMIDIVFSLADNVVIVQAQHFKAINEEKLLGMIPNEVSSKLIIPPKLDSNVKSTVGERMFWAIDQQNSSEDKEKTVIAICGSLFVASEAREALFRINPSMFSESDWVRECDPVLEMTK